MSDPTPTPDAKYLDGLTPQQLLEEVRQIIDQFNREVPGRGRAWPESLKARVFALGRLGVPPSKIAQLSGLSRASVFLWCKNLPRRGRGRPAKASSPEFVQIPVSKNRTVRPLDSARPVVRLDPKMSDPSPSGSNLQLIVRLPSGVEILGLPTVREVADFCRELAR